MTADVAWYEIAMRGDDGAISMYFVVPSSRVVFDHGDRTQAPKPVGRLVGASVHDVVTALDKPDVGANGAGSSWESTTFEFEAFDGSAQTARGAYVDFEAVPYSALSEPRMNQWAGALNLAAWFCVVMREQEVLQANDGPGVLIDGIGVTNYVIIPSSQEVFVRDGMDGEARRLGLMKGDVHEVVASMVEQKESRMYGLMFWAGLEQAGPIVDSVDVKNPITFEYFDDHGRAQTVAGTFAQLMVITPAALMGAVEFAEAARIRAYEVHEAGR